MLRTLLLFTLICLSPHLGHSATTDAPKGPKAYLLESVFEFPPVPAGKFVDHDFILYNRGDEPLKILGVKSG
jgi:hypothetical protein